MNQLAKDLHNSEVIKQRILDQTFAYDLYGALTNNMWVKYSENDEEKTLQALAGTPEHECTISWRAAGALIADMRNSLISGNNQDYMDYYCHGNESVVTDEMRKIFSDLGWTQDENY